MSSPPANLTTVTEIPQDNCTALSGDRVLLAPELQHVCLVAPELFCPSGVFVCMHAICEDAQVVCLDMRCDPWAFLENSTLSLENSTTSVNVYNSTLNVTEAMGLVTCGNDTTVVFANVSTFDNESIPEELWLECCETRNTSLSKQSPNVG